MSFSFLKFLLGYAIHVVAVLFIDMSRTQCCVLVRFDFYLMVNKLSLLASICPFLFIKIKIVLVSEGRNQFYARQV